VCYASFGALKQLVLAAPTPETLQCLAELVCDEHGHLREDAPPLGIIGRTVGTPMVLSCLVEMGLGGCERMRSAVKHAIQELARGESVLDVMTALTDVDSTGAVQRAIEFLTSPRREGSPNSIGEEEIVTDETVIPDEDGGAGDAEEDDIVIEQWEEEDESSGRTETKVGGLPVRILGIGRTSGAEPSSAGGQQESTGELIDVSLGGGFLIAGSRPPTDVVLLQSADPKFAVRARILREHNVPGSTGSICHVKFCTALSGTHIAALQAVGPGVLRSDADRVLHGVGLLQQPLELLSPADIDEAFADIAEDVRREGVLVAVTYLAGPPQSEFISAAIKLIAEGTEPRVARDILVARMEAYLSVQRTKCQKVLQAVLAIRRKEKPAVVKRLLSLMS